MMGALFGMALAFLLDLKDNTIKNTQEVEDMFAYPLQGVVPNFSLPGDRDQLQLSGTATASLPKQIVTDLSMMPLKEAYQNIQVNLKLLDSNAEKKVIAVTSSVPQEGKSSVSANLALARSQCGQRILLIDADMRRPSQHHIWEISNQAGLTNILNHELKWEDCVQNVMPNLDVLTSGTIPEHPIALLDSSSMKAFLKNVSQHYDQVIFDTPPIIGIADTKIIGKLVDGFLFVVRPGEQTGSALVAGTRTWKAQTPDKAVAASMRQAHKKGKPLRCGGRGSETTQGLKMLFLSCRQRLKRCFNALGTTPSRDRFKKKSHSSPAGVSTHTQTQITQRSVLCPLACPQRGTAFA